MRSIMTAPHLELTTPAPYSAPAQPPQRGKFIRRETQNMKIEITEKIYIKRIKECPQAASKTQQEPIWPRKHTSLASICLVTLSCASARYFSQYINKHTGNIQLLAAPPRYFKEGSLSGEKPCTAEHMITAAAPGGETSDRRPGVALPPSSCVTELSCAPTIAPPTPSHMK